jgi:hypothetical protein
LSSTDSTTAWAGGATIGLLAAMNENTRSVYHVRSVPSVCMPPIRTASLEDVRALNQQLSKARPYATRHSQQLRPNVHRD